MDAQEHNKTAEILHHFDYEHLPEKLQQISARCHDLAMAMHDILPMCAETTAGLRKLLEAKDCFVRARVDQR